MTTTDVAVGVIQQALDSIKRECKKSLQEGLETGGALLGPIENGQRKILYALGPGKNAIRTPSRFEKDPEYTVREFNRLNNDNSLKIIGDWHLHPVKGLSAGDKQTLKDVSDDFPGYLALVVCPNSENLIQLFTVEDGKIVQKQFEVIEDSQIDFDRISTLVDVSTMSENSVLVLGLGTGGSLVASHLARCNLRTFYLADSEHLVSLNLPRHIATHNQIGNPKTSVTSEHIKAINPNIITHQIPKNLDASTRDEFAEIIKQVGVALACSGSATANHLTSELCLENKTPLIVGGAFEHASGGMSLLSDFRKNNAPCFNCIFDQASQVHDHSNTAMDAASKRYGWSDEELEAQQGLYVDISPIALLQVKMALAVLSDQTDKLPGNLVIWDAASFSSTWSTVKKREDCAVCSPDAFQASDEPEDEETEMRSSDQHTNSRKET